MSDFFTVVLVPKDTADMKAKVAQFLSPHDQNFRVPPCERPCSCVNLLARLAVDRPPVRGGGRDRHGIGLVR